MISELIRFQARARALGNRLEELDAVYQSGDEDVGRVMRLKSSLESERIEILTSLRELLEENSMPPPLVEAVEQARTEGSEEEVKASLERLAEERGWGKKVVEQIRQHKEDILDLITSIAVKVAKELMTGVP